MNTLLLKWGTVEGWDFEEDCEALQLLRKYMKSSSGYDCITDNPDQVRKELLCRIIDKFDGEIQNDWTGEIMSKEEAKEYILSYHVKEKE